MVPPKSQIRAKITTTNIPKNELCKSKKLHKKYAKKSSKWLYWYAPIILSILSAFVSWAYLKCNFYGYEKSVTWYSELYGWKVVDLFLTYDKDGDFYLSIDEALPLLKQVLSEGNYSEFIDNLPDEDVVTLAAGFSSLNISTMMKNWDEDIGNNESFTGLFEWIHPSIPEKEFGVSKFKDLLPEDLKNIPPPGTVYSILDLGYAQLVDLSSNRFYPPQVQKRGAFLHRLFSMIHQHPFLATRSDPQGAMGCVRAISEDYIEVLFRIHVEFQLNEPPRLPFWFTPGQFSGHLIVSRDLTKVKSFHLYVPSSKRLNVDMEWLTNKNDPEVMEVDIGFMPYMEIKSIGCSHKSNTNLSENNECENETVVWQKEISYEEAKDALDVNFFPFKQVKYFNLTDAFTKAANENKLVHTILLWGALDDQSC